MYSTTLVLGTKKATCNMPQPCLTSCRGSSFSFGYHARRLSASLCSVWKGTFFMSRISPFAVGSVAGLLAISLAPIAKADTLYEADAGSNRIYQFTPGGVKTTFASGLSGPYGLAFDSAGNLFEADYFTSSINKFTPGGVKTTFASGLSGPFGLAFDSAGNLFEADRNSNSINEFTPGGVETIFASGLNVPTFLAFAPDAAATPEPGTFALVTAFALSGIGFARRRRK